MSKYLIGITIGAMLTVNLMLGFMIWNIFSNLPMLLDSVEEHDMRIANIENFVFVEENE